MAGTVDQSQLGRAVRFSELAGIGGGHTFVVVAVHDHQRPRRKPARRVDRSEPAQFTTPLFKVGREPWRAYRTDLTSVLQKSARLGSPVVKVRPWAQQRCAPNARVVGSDARRNRATRVRADQPDTRRAGLVNQVVDRRSQIIDPTLQGEVALAAAAAAEVEGHRHPAKLAGNSVNQFRKGHTALTRIERTNRKAVTEDQPRRWAVPTSGARQVSDELQPARIEAAVHKWSLTSGRSQLRYYVRGLRWRRVWPALAAE